MSNFDEVINDPQGKKVLMYLVAPRNTKHLQFDLVKLMKTSAEHQVTRFFTPSSRPFVRNFSKKDSEVRQRELFDFCKSYFLEYFAEHMDSTIKDGFQGFMMTETIDRLTGSFVLSFSLSDATISLI